MATSSARISTAKRNIFRIFLALALVVLLIPLAPASARAAQTGAAQENAQIEAMLAAGEYAEGEVLAVVLQGDDGIGGLQAASTPSEADQLIASGDTLMEASLEAAAIGTGEATAIDNAGALATQSAASGCEIVHIVSDTLSTRELLYTLSASDRVLAVQPNYIHHVEGVDEQAASAQTASAQTAAAQDAATQTASAQPQAALGAQATDSAAKPNPDLTDTQWGYNDRNLTGNARASAPHKDGFDMGIANWNDPTAVNATGCIAIVDTGVDYNNPDLVNVMANLTDADNAGTNGGPYGYNAATDSSDPMDDFGHGTHCAGIAAAEWNDFGTSGVANGAKIIGVRVTTGGGSILDTNTIKAYAYLSTIMDNGVDVIAVNASWGADMIPCSVVEVCMAEVGKKGAITLLAAGNSDLDIDIAPASPWSVSNNPYVVTVCASETTGTKAFYSNYGQHVCDVYGPGSEIMSTWANTGSDYLGIADNDPISLNVYDGDLGEHFYIAEDPNDAVTSLFNGSLTKDDLPATEDDIVASSYVEYCSSDTVDAGTGSCIIRADESGQLPAYGMFTFYLPIERGRLSEIATFGFANHCLNGPEKNYLVSMVFWENVSDPTDTALYSKYDLGDLLALMTRADEDWGAYGANVAAQMPTPSEGEQYRIYTIPTEDPEIVLVPVAIQIVSTFVFDSPDICIDSVALGSGSSSWTLCDGTSMATPAVTGAAAIAAKVQQGMGMSLSGEVSALWRANYLRAHILTMEDYEDTCRQGGMVNLSIPDDELTPVANFAEQDEGSRVIRITGAYFGKTPGQVTIAGEQCTIESWSDEEIVVSAPAGAAEGEPTLCVSASNGKTSSIKVRYSYEDVVVFPQILPSPAPQLDERFATSFLLKSVGLFSGSLAATEDAVYAVLYAGAEQTIGSILRFDLATKTWSTACDFELNLSAVESCSTNMVEKDGVLYLYVTTIAGNAPARKLLFAYDTASGVIEEINMSETGSKFFSAGFVNAGGTLLLVGGLEVVPESERVTDTTFDNVAELTIEGGVAHINICGDFYADEGGVIGRGVCNPRVAFYDGCVYAAGGTHYLGSSHVASPSLVKLSSNDEGIWESEDISELLPEGLLIDIARSQPTFGLTATSEGLFLVGATVMDESGKRDVHDTYILTNGGSDKGDADEGAADEGEGGLGTEAADEGGAEGDDGNGEATAGFQPWDMVFSLGQVSNVLATSYGDIIYGLAENTYESCEDGTLYFASTEIVEPEPEPEPEPGPEPEPTPDPTPSGNIVNTGDSALPLTIALTACVLAGAVALAARRRKDM